MNTSTDPAGLIGKAIDDYEVVRWLGSGMAGHVYEVVKEGPLRQLFEAHGSTTVLQAAPSTRPKEVQSSRWQ